MKASKFTNVRSAMQGLRQGGAALLAAWGLMLGAGGGSAAEEIRFNRDIRPILSENCFQCHGPDAKHRAADLRLDRRDGAVAAGEHAAIVPGKSAASELVSRITATDPDVKMPPASSGRQLTAEQIDLLKRWIDQGAPYEEHWSLLPPRHVAPPAVRNEAWPRGAIDRFVLARLEKEGLSPSPEAPKSTWLRRVSFDLTGLPPTVEELRAFLADDSADAHEKVVDRLLASERYGERMAMHWLDLARYADTNGYNNDEESMQWPWRDWVIGAFNANLPYDRFVVEQLAGDLLPDPTPEQRVATAFNRNHVFTTEGGIIAEEYRVEYVADRVHTTSTVFLGLSLQCARCHDHKFDPLSQKDYYRFFSFFNNIDEKTVGYNQARVSEPTLKVPSKGQAAEIAKIDAALAGLDRRRSEREAAVAASLAAWEPGAAESLKARLGGRLAGPERLLWLPVEGDDPQTFADALDPSHRGTVHGSVKRVEHGPGSALEFDGQSHVDFGQVGAIDHADPLTVSAWIYPTSNEAIAVLSKIDEGDAFRGYDLIIEQGKPAMHLVHRWPDAGLKVIAKSPVSLGAWHHVVMTYDGSAKGAGLKLYVDGREQPLDVTNDKLAGAGTITTDRPFHLGRRQQNNAFRGRIDDVRLYRAVLAPAEIETLATAPRLESIAAVLAKPAADRTAEQAAELRQYYLDEVDEAYRAIAAERTSLAAKRAELEKSFAVTMVMAEMAKPRQAFVLNRGQYDQPGEPVSAGVPSSLPGLPDGTPANRLGLARWLVEPSHPLTARVAVNRWWQQFFGTGIVETVEDFGSQGAWPTHPELLDFLATEFSGAGTSDGKIRPWDVKSLLREIALSATYRQSSRVTPELLERDPKNRLLARGPRFRLPAETMRDNALAVSGLLAHELGGPSVKPYQPAGLWEDVSVERRVTYQPGQGADLYRRSMYTYWKRTCPPPGMTTFDAPDRETCTIRRARTNTPLQALVLMNDPTYLEAARKLAERVLTDGGADDAARLSLAYMRAVSREPVEAEQTALATILGRARDKFRGTPADAERLLVIGASSRDPKLEPAELAAWTTVCSLILSLDETITKE